MFGEDIKQIRIERGITQTQVSEATGIPQNTISWIESDKGIPNIYQCKLLTDYYGISIDELIGKDSNKN